MNRLYQIWSEAEAFIVNGDVFAPGFMGSPDDEDEDNIMSIHRVSDDFLIYEVYVSYEDVFRGRFTDDFYTFEYENKDKETTTITPLFTVGKKKKRVFR